MTAPTRSSVSRREFLTQAGILAVGFTLAPRLVRGESLGSAPRALAPPDGTQLDSWLVIGRDEQITVYAGKVELGTGVSTALRQIVAEELDVPVVRIAWVQGDSDLTVDQGRTVGSGSVKRGGAQLRSAAATARQALLMLASAKLGVPAERLVVADGVISVDGDAAKRASFGTLIGGSRFERTVSREASVKPRSTYTIVGKSVPRSARFHSAEVEQGFHEALKTRRFGRDDLVVLTAARLGRQPIQFEHLGHLPDGRERRAELV